MFNHQFINRFAIFKEIILLLILTGLLASCGGGGGGSTPEPPAADTAPPFIVNTIPYSEADSISITDFIRVTFNEEITPVTTEQLTIYPVVNGVITAPIKLSNSDSFVFNKQKNTLEVRLKVGELQSKSHYRVTIKNVSDTSNNTMTTPCSWDFTTIEAQAINTGKTGLCGSDPKLELPSKPLQVRAAVVNETNVIINWQAPDQTTGGVASYYQVEKSTNNQQFEILATRNTSLRYSDTAAVKNLSHIYKITAGNDNKGLGSETALSNEVFPNVGLSTNKPVTNLISANPARLNRFGENLLFSPDGSTLAVGEYNGDVGNIIDAGTAQIFSKSPTGKWQLIDKLTSNAPTSATWFGRALQFSPNSKILAVGEPRANLPNAKDAAGQVHIFNKLNNGRWTPTITLQSRLSAKSNWFGTNLLFSPDNLTLAIGEPNGDVNRSNNAGSIQLFSNSSGTWTYIKTLNSETPSVNNYFSHDAMLFSPDGKTLAVGERNGDSATHGNNIGSVQMFSNTSGVWLPTDTLYSSKPAISNWFGYNLQFSPNSTTLAVGEYYGDTVDGITDAGTVHVFSISNTGNWKLSKILKSETPETSNWFGNSLQFSPDSTILAVGEKLGDPTPSLNAGTVQLFTKRGNWTTLKTLTSTTPAAKNNFGNRIQFNPDGSMLAVGEYGGGPAGAENTGTVQIFTIKNSVWAHRATLVSTKAATGNFFGYDLQFSPTEAILAIGERNGDPAAARDAGSVSIFDLTKLP
ncbi:MAG: Ig-like domain-containing protein [Gammaproteobacteria bacterium]